MTTLAVADAWKEFSAKHVNSEFVDAVDCSNESAMSLLAILPGKKNLNMRVHNYKQIGTQLSSTVQ